MKQIVIGCVAALSIFAFACGGGGGASGTYTAGPDCVKFLACAKKIGGSTDTNAQASYGPNSMCTKSCETACSTLLPQLETMIMSGDGGTCK